MHLYPCAKLPIEQFDVDYDVLAYTELWDMVDKTIPRISCGLEIRVRYG